MKRKNCQKNINYPENIRQFEVGNILYKREGGLMGNRKKRKRKESPRGIRKLEQDEKT